MHPHSPKEVKADTNSPSGTNSRPGIICGSAPRPGIICGSAPSPCINPTRLQQADLNAYLTGLPLSEWQFTTHSKKHLKSGYTGHSTDSLHQTLVKMHKHPQWHPRSQCHPRMHPPPKCKATITIPPEWSQMTMVPEGTITMTPEKILALAMATEERLVGGAMFKNSKAWQKLFPNTQAAAWMKQGGVSWRSRPSPQQAQPPPPSTSEPALTLTSSYVTQLMQEQVYELVTDTPSQELEQKQAYQAWYTQQRQSNKPPPVTASYVQHVQAGQPQKANPATLRQKALQSYTPSNAKTSTSSKSKSKPQQHQLHGSSSSNSESDSSDPPSNDLTTDPVQSCYSRIFCTQDGEKVRALHDMKTSGANKTVRGQKFKCDNITTLHGHIKPGDYFMKWDLRKAFHQVLVHPLYRRLMKSMVALTNQDIAKLKLNKDETKLLPKPKLKNYQVARLQQRTLAQGFIDSSRILKKMLTPAIVALRKMGMRTCLATDDLLLAVSDIQTGMLQGYVITYFLGHTLNCIFSGNKGVYNLPQRIEWFGAAYCSVTSVTMLPAAKVTKIVSTAMMLIKMLKQANGTTTFRTMEKVYGAIMATKEAVDATRIMSTHIKRLKDHMAEASMLQRDTPIQISSVPISIREKAIEQLGEWVCNYHELEHKELITWNGKYHHCGYPMATIFTDACEWQAGFNTPSTNNHPEINMKLPFTAEEATKHITHLEQDGATDGVLSTVLQRNLTDGCFALCVDASAALPYQQNMGGRIQALTAKMQFQQQELKRRRLVPLVYHIPGKINPGDKPSRQLVGLSEYRLAPKIFKWCTTKWGKPSIDLFAAKWNNQLPSCATMNMAGRSATAYNGLTMDLTPYTANKAVVWMFPPPHHKILCELVRRVELQQLEVILIMPLWPATYLSEAIKLMVDTPLLIEVNNSNLLPPTGYQVHNITTDLPRLLSSKTWRTMIGARMSGNTKRAEEFRKTWRRTHPWSTSQARIDAGAITLMSHGRSCAPITKKSSEPAHTLSQMLFSAI